VTAPVVVGGGFVGLCSALKIRQRGLPVALVDPGEATAKPMPSPIVGSRASSAARSSRACRSPALTRRSQRQPSASNSAREA
jgi:glycine/D-amino acid oxidase-like deaminating enzyme